MNIATTLPYSWLRSISTDLLELDALPLFGSPPPFPWEAYGKALSEALRIENISLSPVDTAWRTEEELLEGLGSDPLILALHISPLAGRAYWMFPREELKELMKVILAPEDEIDLVSEEWQDDFYTFLTVEAIQAFNKTKYDPTLTPQVASTLELPKTSCLSVDIQIVTSLKTFNGRLVITPEMRAAISQKYAVRKLAYPTGISAAVAVQVHLLAGSVTLTPEEWKSVQPGDFVLLDSCSLTPEENKGRILLSVNNSTLFRGKIKDGNIKILEYPLLQEVNSPMAKEEEQFEDEEAETEGEETEEEFEEEEEFTEEEEEEEFTEEEENLTEEEVEEGTDLEEEDEEEKTHLEEEIPEDEHPEAKTSKSISKPAKETFKRPEELPLTIAIEVGRIQMSIQQLMDLSPGNILELNVHPENGVDLVANGHCIGKGELLKIGDALGVRILDKA